MMVKCRYCKKDLLQENSRQVYHTECTAISRKKSSRLPIVRSGVCHTCKVPIIRTCGNSRFCKACASKRAKVQRREWSKNHPRITKAQKAKAEQLKLIALASKIIKVPETVRRYT